MGTGSFPGIESDQGVTLTPHFLLVPRSKNRVAILLISLRAFVTCKKDESYLSSYVKRQSIAANVVTNNR
jgi:hypothetical protein